MMLDNGRFSKILLVVLTVVLLGCPPPVCRGVKPGEQPGWGHQPASVQKNEYHNASRALHTSSEHVISSGEGVANLISPGFPYCCNSILTATYTVTYTGAQNIYGIALLFDDIDLPPDSTIQIHDVNRTVYASPLPRYTREGWTRPFVVLRATTLELIVKFGVKGDRLYVGFKADCWAELVEPTYEIPYTDCPAAGDPMDGGEVRLDTTYLEHRGMRGDYWYNCVWQLKPPPPSLDLIVYLRIQGMDLRNEGTAIIRRGTNSRTGVQIVQYGNEILHSDTDNLQQPEDGFVSVYGFYIRVIKEVSRGYFHFSYGVYADVGLTATYNTECNYGSKGNFMKGYHCQRGSTWCIPEEHRCNGIKNCPYGDDEDEEMCTAKVVELKHKQADAVEHPVLSGAVSPDLDVEGCEKKCESNACFYECSVGVPCPSRMKKCGNRCILARENCYEGCPTNMKKCGEICIDTSTECVSDCLPSEKRCQDGSCINTNSLCSEESCPMYRPMRCRTGGHCYYGSEQCDGKTDCLDGSDEEDCYEICEKEGLEMCEDGHGCYRKVKQCNDAWDCADGSDETNCSNEVTSNRWKRSVHGYVTVMILILLAIISIFLVSKYRRFRSARQNLPVDQESAAAVTQPPGTRTAPATQPPPAVNGPVPYPVVGPYPSACSQTPTSPTFISVPPPEFSAPQPELPPSYDEAVRLLSPPVPTEDPPSYSELDPVYNQESLA